MPSSALKAYAHGRKAAAIMITPPMMASSRPTEENRC
jgi:hypothetical protein